MSEETKETASVVAPEQDGVMDVVEDIVKQITEEHFDKLFQEGLEKLKDVIPGEQFDTIVTVLLTKFKPHLKAGLLKLEDKIDGKIG